MQTQHQPRLTVLGMYCSMLVIAKVFLSLALFETPYLEAFLVFIWCQGRGQSAGLPWPPGAYCWAALERQHGGAAVECTAQKTKKCFALTFYFRVPTPGKPRH
eukprot:1145914-Pelagomonas_calceolata.AAC.4